VGAEMAEDALACLAADGDNSAFAALCHMHRRRLWRTRAAFASGEELEDLAQEAVVRAYCSLRTYRADAPFGAWLCRIAVNLAHDRRRSAWRRRVVVTPTVETRAAESPDMLAARREMQRRVRQAVCALPERHRVPLWLHYFEGYSVAEIARLEGAPESTLRGRMKQGLARLAGPLADLLEEEGVEGAGYSRARD